MADSQIAFHFNGVDTRHSPVSYAIATPRSRVPKRAAVRVPDAWREAQLTLPTLPQIFVHEGARQLLEKRLSALTGERVLLAVTDNRRTMISSKRTTGLLHVRLHHMFLGADMFTTRALGHYLAKADRHTSATLGGFIEANRQQIKPPAKRPHAFHTVGSHHDLGEIFNDLNRRYFQGSIDARISWGKKAQATRRRRRRSSIRLGTYCSEQKLIRIHPALDQEWVPRYFVEYVVFHEMLHHVVPMPVSSGRRALHSEEFRERERRYPHFDRALAWERRHVPRLLAS